MDRRSTGRISLSNSKNINAILPEINLKVSSIDDISSGGLSFSLATDSLPSEIESAKSIKIYSNKKYIGSKPIKNIALHRSINEHSRVSVSFINRFKSYLPKNKLERIKRGYYSVNDGEKKLEYVLSSILCEEPIVAEKRRFERVRLPFDGNSTVVILNKNGETLLISKKINDVTSKGVSFYADSVDSTLQYNSIDRMRYYYSDRLLSERRINKIEVESNHRPIKIRIIFDELVSTTKIFSKLLASQSEDGIFRVHNVSETNGIIQSMLSTKNDVEIKFVKDNEEKEKIYKLLFDTYIEEGTIKEEDYPDKKVVDKLDKYGEHLGIYVKDNLIATARIIYKHLNSNDTEKFEVEENWNLSNHLDPTKTYAEVSRLCVNKYFRKSVNNNINLSLTIFLKIFREVISKKIDYLIISPFLAHEYLYEMLGFRRIVDPVEMVGFNEKCSIMVVDLHNFQQYMYPLITPYFEKIYKEVAC